MINNKKVSPSTWCSPINLEFLKFRTVLCPTLSLLLLSSVAWASGPTPTASDAAVNWSNSAAGVADGKGLHSELEGFGYETTGGLNGVLYTVTNTSDYNPEDTTVKQNQKSNPAYYNGTLRYGVLNSDPTKPLWIQFASALKGSTIELTKTLNLRDNMTIDGRGENITLSTLVNWSNYKLLPSTTGGRPNCTSIHGSGEDWISVLTIVGVQNVILTHLHLTHTNFYNSPWIQNYREHQALECVGENVTVSNAPSALGYKPTSVVDNIWLNHLTLDACADECIDITRPTQAGHSRITVSNNLITGNYQNYDSTQRFIGPDKPMDIGSDYDNNYNLPVLDAAGKPVCKKAANGNCKVDAQGKEIDYVYTDSDPDVTSSSPYYDHLPPTHLYYEASLYGNFFNQPNERNPRTVLALVHIYNNLFYNWSSYLAGNDAAKIFFERNLFYSDIGFSPQITSMITFTDASIDETYISDNTSVTGRPLTYARSSTSLLPSGTCRVDAVGYRNMAQADYVPYRESWLTGAPHFTLVNTKALPAQSDIAGGAGNLGQ